MWLFAEASRPETQMLTIQCLNPPEAQGAEAAVPGHIRVPGRSIPCDGSTASLTLYLTDAGSTSSL